MLSLPLKEVVFVEANTESSADELIDQLEGSDEFKWCDMA